MSPTWRETVPPNPETDETGDDDHVPEPEEEVGNPVPTVPVPVVSPLQEDCDDCYV